MFIEPEVVIDEISQYEIERNKPMPSRNHSFIESKLSSVLWGKFGEEFDFFSELDIALPGLRPAVPDLAVYPKTDIDPLEDISKMTVPPLTTIEILSRKQAFDDLKDKIFDIYFPGGVKSCWIIIPTLRSVHIFSPDRKVATFTTGSLHDPATGIELELDSFFP